MKIKPKLTSSYSRHKDQRSLLSLALGLSLLSTWIVPTGLANRAVHRTRAGVAHSRAEPLAFSFVTNAQDYRTQLWSKKPTNSPEHLVSSAENLRGVDVR